MGFGGDVEAAGAGGGEDRPKRSLERDDEGGLGFAGLVVGEAKPPKKSCPLDDMEVVRD